MGPVRCRDWAGGRWYRSGRSVYLRQRRPMLSGGPQMIVGCNATWAPQAPSSRSEGLPKAGSIHGRARGDLAESDQTVNDRLHLIGAQTFAVADASLSQSGIVTIQLST